MSRSPSPSACKDYHATLRVAPPLVITREEIDFGVDAIAEVLG